MIRHLRAPTRMRLFAFAAATLLVGGVACSGITALRPSAPAPTTAPPVAQTRSASQPAVPAPLPAADAAPAVAAAGGVAAQSPASDQSSGANSAVADTSAQILDRMVIRTAQLTVEVPDGQLESALAKARDIAAQGGGYVSASNTHYEDSGSSSNPQRMVADLTLQVRSESADSVMSSLRGLGKVTAETSGSQDVTDEYVDLDSNLRNLQATESAILKLMDKATQISDVLALQRELTNVRGQIERIQGRKTYLERRTDMATITLSLRLPPATSQPTASGAWDPIANALRGWQASLTVLRGVADVLIIVLAFSWWLVPLVGVGIYVWLHRRRVTRTSQPPIII